jgi:hypothetical protein
LIPIFAHITSSSFLPSFRLFSFNSSQPSLHFHRLIAFLTNSTHYWSDLPEIWIIDRFTPSWMHTDFEVSGWVWDDRSALNWLLNRLFLFTIE